MMSERKKNRWRRIQEEPVRSALKKEEDGLARMRKVWGGY